ncbi:TolC family protein [Bryobacter aggregatus]|uniref:TolC family protein n=1 Tax=Bryobacter aggregatus TaxID=360054 RepID=UPI0006922BCB|nr:TolC family protein [Bryobacter aggregatus]
MPITRFFQARLRWLCAFWVFAAHALAQPTLSSRLNLQQAVDAALERYPSVRVSEEELRSATAAIQLARTAYLPSLEAVAGINRATRNNVLGLLLPSQVLSPISGPVLGTNGLGSAWGSTVGLLATWEPFDFGLRQANVAVAQAGRARAEAIAGRTRLDIATIVADTVLTIVAAEQTIIAARAAADRSAELVRIIDALVRTELRPGAELSLAEAEQASAQAQLIRARQAEAEAKGVLGALLGIEPKTLSIDAGKLLTMAGPLPQTGDLSESPLAREQDAATAEVQARLRVLDRSYYPRFAIQGTSYARGTGAISDGRLLGGVNGLGPNIQNWGLGFTATFNVFEYQAIRARRSAESAHLDAERARYSQVLVDLRARQNKASAAFEGALEVAQTTPVVVDAARHLTEQARARYQSGLGTALEVADAHRRLAQAEIDDSLARLGTWRAKLALFAATGNLSPLLIEASQ